TGLREGLESAAATGVWRSSSPVLHGPAAADVWAIVSVGGATRAAVGAGAQGKGAVDQPRTPARSAASGILPGARLSRGGIRRPYQLSARQPGQGAPLPKALARRTGR